MNEAEKRIHDIIDKLTEQLALGWRAYLIARSVNQAHREKRINCAFHFFEGVYASCMESAFLALARVILKDERGKPVNIWYLLNCLQGKPDVFASTPMKTIQYAVAEHTKQLQQLESTIQKISAQRHQTIAHLDKMHVNKPDELNLLPPLEEKEIEGAYKLLLNILNTYTGYYRPSVDISHIFEYFNQGVTDDLEYVVGLIERDNQMP